MKLLFTIAFAALCMPQVAFSQVYKCTVNGAVAYQGTPCSGKNATQTLVSSSPPAGFEGCYAFRLHSATEGFTNTEGMRIVRDGGNDVLTDADGSAQGLRLRLRRATPAELKMLSRLFGATLSDGMSAADLDRPVGIYKSAKGYFLYAFFSSGPGERVPCK